MPRVAVPVASGLQEPIYEQPPVLDKSSVDFATLDSTASVAVTPGLSQAYGSYVQLTAGLTRDTFIYGWIGYSNHAATAGTSEWTQWAIGTGPSGSEKIIAEMKGPGGTASVSGIAQQPAVTPCNLPYPIFVPAGTRLAVKAATTNAANAWSAFFHLLTIPASITTYWPTMVVDGRSTQSYRTIGSLAVSGATISFPTGAAYGAAGNMSATAIPEDGVAASFQASEQVVSAQGENAYMQFLIGSVVALETQCSGCGQLTGGTGMGNPGAFAVPPIFIPGGAQLTIKGKAPNASINRTYNVDLNWVPIRCIIPVTSL